LSQSSLPIGELETAGELHDRLSSTAALVLKVADELSRGVAKERQDERRRRKHQAFARRRK
jgi:methionyl-tRNA formyltransferase